MEEKHENKRRFMLWVKPSTVDLVEASMKLDNSGSRSEFIEKAILFYCGYVTTNRNENYIPNIVLSTLKAMIKESEIRTGNALFKIAVELSLLMNTIVATNPISEETVEILRKDCIAEVKKLNGNIDIEKAIEWQK